MTQGSSVSLTVRAVRHAFGATTVLDGIDLDASAGEVTVLLGPSGCGKSTLLSILGGLLTYVFQDFALLPWRTTSGNVALALEGTRLTRDARDARVAEMLALCGLSDFADAWPRQLSGGMRQRVGIARALAVRPAVLLMDEPLSALDAQTRALLLDEFGVTAVYVTHNLPEAVRLGHRIVVLSRRPGRVREVMRVERPILERRSTDPDLIAIEAALWSLNRDDAADADREASRVEA